MKIATRTGIAPDDQRLMFGVRPLKDRHTLHHYKIRRDSTMWLSLSLGGAGPAKRPRTEAASADKSMSKNDRFSSQVSLCCDPRLSCHGHSAVSFGGPMSLSA